MNCNNFKLKNVPTYERPRERLLRQGSGALSDVELLAILLRTGTEKDPVHRVAQRLLAVFGDLQQLAAATNEELTDINGIGPVKAVEIQAALELGRRSAIKARDIRISIRLPKDVADFMMPEMAGLVQEHFVCLFLNTKNQVIGKKTVFVGSLDSSIVHPRDIYREAIKRSCASIICLHNHPSGDPAPSKEDINVTKILLQAGDLVGIPLLDHLIIGDGHYVSLKEQGYM
ncbi:JAB domain-containing protein [Brevibacillus sp. 7WMA2]|uniref:RadC family protein n=1 Tax=Brevibacillus TaxID=55080 RepID=UPI0013A7984D|nr:MULTISPECIES: DNA repair protein RadC [Brevibacillus]MCR8994060.1 DNA repair protein RadC [Brevibacillus laterosporus]MDF9411217.1 JAB domain-containing protein [Brevibacillus laterosporus]QIC08039.1 JAB domain-containing protein [Brevibacillus sp. 7WMA2]WPS89096.1 DNA repair protein RadC [Brevibacillus halotolerans]